MRMNETVRNSNTTQHRTSKATITDAAAHRGARWKRAARLTVAALLLLVVGGCTRKKTEASNENFKRAINAYFYNGRDECLFVTAQKFPGEVKVGEKAEMKGMV